MLNGVPLSSAIYRKVADRLKKELAATSYLVDLPGTGGSSMTNGDYSWLAIRECIHSYLAGLPAHTLVMDDLAPLAVLPLPGNQTRTQGLVILNAVIRPSEVHPPFPLNFLRCFPRLAVILGSITPRAVYLARFRALGIARPEMVNKDELRALYAEMRADKGLGRLAKLMSGIALNEETDQSIIAGLETPIPQLFIWGVSDPVLGNEYKKLPELTSNQTLVVFPGAKHFLMLDYPDEITRAIADWRR